MIKGSFCAGGTTLATSEDVICARCRSCARATVCTTPSDKESG
jgi:hypothetical protein